MAPHSQRSWFRWHWLTLILAAWLTWAIADCQVQRQSSWMYGNYDSGEMDFMCGWPFRHLIVRNFKGSSDEILLLFLGPPSDRHTWYVRALVIDGAFWLVLMGSLVVVSERWLRSRNRLQFGMQALLALTGVAAVLVAILSQNTPYWVFRLGLEPSFEVEWCNLRKPLRYILPVGIGCATYVAGWLLCRLLIFGWTSARRLLDRSLKRQAANCG